MLPSGCRVGKRERITPLLVVPRMVPPQVRDTAHPLMRQRHQPLGIALGLQQAVEAIADAHALPARWEAETVARITALSGCVTAAGADRDASKGGFRRVSCRGPGE